MDKVHKQCVSWVSPVLSLRCTENLEILPFLRCRLEKYSVVDVISVLNVALESVVSGRQEEACSSGYTHIAGWKIIDRRTKKTYFDEQLNEQGTVPLETSAQEVCGDGGKITVFLFSFYLFIFFVSTGPRSPNPRCLILDPRSSILDPRSRSCSKPKRPPNTPRHIE